MTEKITIEFTSIIEQFNDKISHTQLYSGDYTIKHSHFIRYIDKELGATTIKWDKQQKTVTLLFQNHATKKMVFNETVATDMYYQLPQQTLHLTIKTKKITCLSKDDFIKKLVIYYDLKDGNELFGHYKMSFVITKQNNN